MARERLSTLMTAATLLLTPALLAQGSPMPPPPLMLFVREEVKPGHGAAHAATESAWSRTLAKGKVTDHYLGMSALTGPSEAWFIMGYDSYADWEAKQKELDPNPALKAEIDKVAQQDGEHLTGSRTILGALRKDLSYGPPVEIGKMRYVRIRIFRIKSGQGKAFEDSVKMAIEAYTKSRFPASFAFYEVMAGMPSSSYVVIRPMKSLAEQDVISAGEKAFQDALGEEGRKAMQKAFVETVNSVENQFFALDPRLSYPGPSVIASDPAFWTPKPPKPAAK